MYSTFLLGYSSFNNKLRKYPTLKKQMLKNFVSTKIKHNIENIKFTTKTLLKKENTFNNFLYINIFFAKLKTVKNNYLFFISKVYIDYKTEAIRIHNHYRLVYNMFQLFPYLGTICTNNYL